MANAIIDEFQSLKDDEGQGFVSTHVHTIIILCYALTHAVSGMLGKILPILVETLCIILLIHYKR